MAVLAAILPAAAQAFPAPKLEFSAFEMQLAQTVASDPGLAAFYGAHDLKPVFTGPGAESRRNALIEAVSTAPDHGLPPDRYATAGLNLSGDAMDVASEVSFARLLSRWANDVSNGLVDPAGTAAMNKREVIPVDMEALLVEMTTGDPAAALAELPPQDPAYLQLMEMLAGQARLIAPAGTPMVSEGLYRPGSQGQGVRDLRTRLQAIGFAPETPPEDEQVFDENLRQTVAEYQKAAGLPVDGIAGPKTIGQLNGTSTGPQTRRLMIAMERLRWLNGHDLNTRMIWVNIPSYMAEIREDGRATFTTRVVVGESDPDWQTPEFSDRMEFVVPNPSWNVPRSIAAESYLPRLRANRYAVSHLDVVDRRGRVIPRENIDFSQYSDRNFPYFLRQKPSPDNALGLVKFLFPNKWNIYLHDTPSKGLFGNSNRAASHGCIRVARPFDLAYELLRGNSDNPQALFQRMLDTGEEKWLKLDDTIPVHLVYFTSIPGPDGQLLNYRDIYGRDGPLWAAMQKAAAAGS
ncbi:L,D-transpeptidase family protein [Paracoccus aerodenitrificans]|uniref:L,D-transpeptidase family protein n=1 Tax=Paracoccus aerodenitrificans TaxID=3017781 RepID=UPI0022F02FD9|nr:L,D-transpeptidase family protein [Paracoccus aerodenitrificans]WBU65428.1 L,D-transpeptidase family protein [Paracoccus aerodenitrificans]